MGTRAWGAAALLSGVFWVSCGFAADWSLVPSINAKTEFNSNLNSSYTNQVSDFIFTLSPATEFNYTTEAYQLQGKLGLTGLHYLRHDQIDHIDQNYQINGQYRVSPRWNLSLRTSYIVDSTMQEELATSALIMTRTPRESIQFGPGITYNVTEKLAATVNYNFNIVNYQDPQFRNYTSQQVGLRLDYPLKNQKTLLTSNVLVRETRYPGSDLYRSLGINLGGLHKFSENWEVNLMAGVNISFLDFQTQVADFSTLSSPTVVPQARLRQTSISPSINVSTTRRWTNLSVTAGLSRDESASAFASISEVNRIFGAMKYILTEKMEGTLSGDYSLSNQASQRNNLQGDYLSISPQLNYRVTEKLTASPGYRFSLREDITNSKSAATQSIWLMLTYSYPIHYQK